MKVGQVCSRNVICAPASAPLSEVASLMRTHHIGAVVITKSPLDQPVAAGMITDRDIVLAQIERTADLNRLRAEDVMTADPLVVSEDDSIEDAIQRLRTRRVRRAPVVTSHGALVGFVSTDDLIAQIARELTAIARVLELQSKRQI